MLPIYLRTCLVLLLLRWLIRVYKTDRVGSLHNTHRVQGKTYRMLKAHPVTRPEALERLVFLRNTAMELSTRIEPSKGAVLAARLQTAILQELAPPHTRFIASTRDKGVVINICLRDASSGALLSREHSVYVFVHELAHVITKSFGHTKEFQDNMATLVQAAKQAAFLSSPLKEALYCGQLVQMD